MKTPYTVLGVSEHDDAIIKKAYLKAVRQNPPDRNPERFREIRQAYEQIATHRDRLRYELFDTSIPDHLELAELLFKYGKGKTTVTKQVFQRALQFAITRKNVNVQGESTRRLL